jgi:hypothetical protein
MDGRTNQHPRCNMDEHYISRCSVDLGTLSKKSAMMNTCMQDVATSPDEVMRGTELELSAVETFIEGLVVLSSSMVAAEDLDDAGICMSRLKRIADRLVKPHVDSLETRSSNINTCQHATVVADEASTTPGELMTGTRLELGFVQTMMKGLVTVSSSSSMVTAEGLADISLCISCLEGIADRLVKKWKQHVCSLCRNRFSSCQALRRHCRIHAVWPLRETLSRPNELRRHMKRRRRT